MVKYFKIWYVSKVIEELEKKNFLALMNDEHNKNIKIQATAFVIYTRNSQKTMTSLTNELCNHLEFRKLNMLRDSS